MSRFLCLVAACMLQPVLAQAGLPLETESARIMDPGTFKVETAVEFQTSSEGREIAVPLALEYAFTKDFEFQVEPVFFTAILPVAGKKSEGLGDLEATATFRVVTEDTWWPNLAFAVEVKFPTARDLNIGTGEYDYTGYLIATKRFFGQVDLHLNLGYTVVGSPPGVTLKNMFDYAFAIDWHVTEKLDLLAEVLGNTASAPNAESGGEVPGLTPEASGGEMSGLLGVRYQFIHGLYGSLGVTYDNSNAVLFRLGITCKFSLFGEKKTEADKVEHAAAPEAPRNAEEPKSAEEPKPADKVRPVEETKPLDQTTPAEETKPTGETTREEEAPKAEEVKQEGTPSP